VHERLERSPELLQGIPAVCCGSCAVLLIERKLAARHLGEGSLALYDLSSSYFEDTHCPLGKIGNSRDGKKNKLQVNYGLMTTRQGSTLAEEFGVSAADEDDVYAAMDWLLERQPSGPRGHRFTGPGVRGPVDSQGVQIWTVRYVSAAWSGEGVGERLSRDGGGGEFWCRAYTDDCAGAGDVICAASCSTRDSLRW
jgi:hypothetical protein